MDQLRRRAMLLKVINQLSNLVAFFVAEKIVSISRKNCFCFSKKFRAQQYSVLLLVYFPKEIHLFFYILKLFRIFLC